MASGMRLSGIVCLLAVLNQAGYSQAAMPTGGKYTNTIGMKFVRVEPGEVEMGQINTPLPSKLLLLYRGRGRMDFLRDGDFDADGKVEFLYDHDGCHAETGPFYVVNAMTGNLELKIDYKSQGLRHAQYMVADDFRPDMPGLELVCTGKGGGIFMWRGNGNLLWKNDAAASLCAKDDWDGDGTVDLFVFALGANKDGIFSVWNGLGERLYAISFLPSPTIPLYEIGDYSHALMAASEMKRKGAGAQDLDANGKPDLLMAFGAWHVGSDQNLFLMEAP